MPNILKSLMVNTCNASCSSGRRLSEEQIVALSLDALFLREATSAWSYPTAVNEIRQL